MTTSEFIYTAAGLVVFIGLLIISVKTTTERPRTKGIIKKTN